MSEGGLREGQAEAVNAFLLRVQRRINALDFIGRKAVRALLGFKLGKAGVIGVFERGKRSGKIMLRGFHRRR